MKTILATTVIIIANICDSLICANHLGKLHVHIYFHLIFAIILKYRYYNLSLFENKESKMLIASVIYPVLYS